MNVITSKEFSYDPYSREVLDNPLPYYAELLAHRPGYYVEKYDMFIFTRFKDFIDVLGVVENNTFVGSESTLPMPQEISHRNAGAPPLPSTNPMAPGPTLPSPQYEEMRLAHIKPLRPKSVAAIEDFTRDLARERLRLLVPQGKFEMMLEYCGMVSAAVTCHLYGIPLSETKAVLDMVSELAAYSESLEGVNIPGMFELLATRFILPAIERRRAAGADGSVPIVDGLITHRTRGDNRALDDGEIANQLVCAFVANTETPPKPASQGLLALCQNPDQLATVRADLATNVPIAVEEMLRVCMSNQFGVRTAHKDVDVAGVHIKAGQRVLVSPFSANRDPLEFGEDADKFVWNRPIRQLATFGYGQHHCIGNHIARMQIRVLVREFLEHVSDYEFAMDEAVHGSSYFHWGWTKLPVVIKSHSI